MIFNYFLGIITVECRECLLSSLISDLEDKQGIKSYVIYKNNLPLGFDNLKLNWLNFLNDFNHSVFKYAIFLEDDIIISDRFFNGIKQCELSCFDLISLCLVSNSFYKIRSKFNNGVYSINNKKNYYGSIGLFFNKKTCRSLLKNFELINPKFHFDKLLGLLSYQNEYTFGYITPNIINHKKERCTWRKNGRTFFAESKCFK